MERTPERLQMVREARVESLPDLRGFVREACARAGIGGEVCEALELATDEVCTNIVTHGYAGAEPGEITVAFGREADAAVITIADSGAPFPPGNAPPPDLASDWEERQVGGLGWHIVRQMVDEIRYHTGNGRNEVALVKRLSPAPRK